MVHIQGLPVSPIMSRSKPALLTTFNCSIFLLPLILEELPIVSWFIVLYSSLEFRIISQVNFCMIEAKFLDTQILVFILSVILFIYFILIIFNNHIKQKY